jgi:hypothetical protein
MAIWRGGLLVGASINVKPVRADDIDISFSEIIDHLDFAFMTTLGARKGKWSRWRTSSTWMCHMTQVVRRN